MENIFIAAVVGPTASGKTGLAVRIAQALDGEIVSADSMQIYKGMDIAVAMPTPLERKQAVHHMIDFLDRREPYSVARYTLAAKTCIQDIAARKKLPILCGGTGLYVDSLLGGIRFLPQATDGELRARLNEQYEQQGGERMLEQLRTVDAASAAVLHPHDKKRIVRALELAFVTGKTKTEQNLLSRPDRTGYRVCRIGLTATDRQYLYERIDRRVDAMLDSGLEQQARDFFAAGDTQTSAQAIGYKELKPYFDGECTRQEAIESLKRQTRRYAKRQLTWFRRDPDTIWLPIDEMTPDGLAERAVQIIQRERSLYG